MAKRKEKREPRPKPAASASRRTPEEPALTLAEVIAALKGASLVREEEVRTAAEAAARGLAGLPAGLWDRLRRALFTRIRLGRREKPLGQILREVNWVDRQELDQAEAEVAATGAPLGKLLLDRGLISPETLKTARRIQEETGEPLWRTLISMKFILPRQLLDLLRQEVYLPFLDSKDVRLGEALMELHVLTQAQLDAGLRLRRKTSRPFGEVLLEADIIDEKQLALGFARQHHVDMVDLAEAPPEADAFDQLPNELIRENQALPIRYRPAAVTPEGPAPAELVVACADPQRLSFIRNLGAILGLMVTPVVAPHSQVEEGIAMAMRQSRPPAETPVPPAAAGPSSEPEARPAAAAPATSSASRQLGREVAEQRPIVELVDSILLNAVRARTTDIHLDPQEDGLRVRYRIDGVLHDVLHAPTTATSGIVSRLKVLADMDIVERRLPQDAHLTVTVAERPLNMRMATVPTELGEKVVLRLMDEARVITGLDSLGLEPKQREAVEEFLRKPYGMLLVVGPVGSGKTTTLYSCMTQLNSPGKNLMSVEDPVEYRLPGTNQLQVFRRIGFDFAAGLRAILRQDPDVIMVGEIRDDETARTAVRAALTGVFVMSSVHAQDAAATVAALFHFGVPGFLVSGALVGVIAQRLVRRVCPECKIDYKPDVALLRQLGLPTTGKGRPRAFYRGEGCEHCFHTGYHGRTGLFEVLPMSEEVKDLIYRETTKEVLGQTARDLGMQSLRQSGLNRLLDGTTSVEEYFRVTWT